MKTWCDYLARLAYWLACVSCFCMVWMALTYPVPPPRRLPTHTAQVVWWTLYLYAPLSIVLGGIAWLAISRPRRPKQALSHAQAAVLLGAIAWLVITINTVLLQARRRLSAKDPSCASNEKQLALAMRMYAQDYDEHYPSASWNKATMPYVKTDFVYRCPEEVNERVPSYGMNVQLVGKTDAQLDRPSETVMLIDCTPGVNRLVSKLDFPFTGRHDGLVSLASADGHVTGKKANEALALTWELQEAKSKR